MQNIAALGSGLDEAGSCCGDPPNPWFDSYSMRVMNKTREYIETKWGHDI